MRHLRTVLLGGLCALVISTSQAQDDEASAGVLMNCTYGKFGATEVESTTLAASNSTERWAGQSASSVRMGERSKQTSMIVMPGRFAECLYPSGRSVRVKVGVGIARAYGMCGADPEVFLSLWVNQRKVESSVTFAGHCMELGELGYSISRDGIEKCSTSISDDAAEESPSTACVQFPAAEKYPIDELEYPTGPHAATGSIQIQSGDHAICRAVQAELTSSWYAFFRFGRPLSFEQAKFLDPSADLARPLAGSRESTFDFDNDGAPDRVFHKEFMSNYMHGSTLLINPEMTASAEVTGGWFLPCQIDAPDVPLKQCPPFSQAKDAAGFSMPDSGADSVYFHARYSHLFPFRHEQITYLAVSSESANSRDFVAILKPRPGRSFERMCLLRKVPEDF